MPKVVFTEDQNALAFAGVGHLPLPLEKGQTVEIGPLVPSGLDLEQMQQSNLKAIVSEWAKAVSRTRAAEGHPSGRYGIAKCRICVESKSLISARP